MNRTITVTGVEPAILSIRHPLGIDLDLNVKFLKQNTSPYTPTWPQFVLLPRSKGGTLPFDMTITDTANGIANVQVQGAALVDVSGYNIELYMRKTADNPVNPPVPISLAAKGTLLTEGSSYQQTSLSETILPTVAGLPGPAGPAGDPGAQGVRGSIWYTGSGIPGLIAGVQTGDMYLDEATGDVYRYANGMWTRGTF